ncbi:hypothetical protein [Thalassospira lucentensis]|uniref:hypothetical protein n=1 Tax=Thalassospira lucentensis TaxID=168935 RepID=UPI0029439FC6|nr:hypothetical protein [Thalassospira lucentensis]WOI10159.1 hypothetical protein R1T41_16725 [Thalassospira lucentensis]
MDTSSILTAVASFVVSLGGGAGICLMMSSWIGRLWADRLMAQETEKFRKNTERELELLRSEHRKTFHIHSLQFETEFHALRSLWAKLGEASVATSALRPMFEMVDQNESKESRKIRKGNWFIESYRELEVSFASERPFISEDLEMEIASIMAIMLEEYIDFDEMDDGKIIRYKEAKERIKKMNASVESLSKLIRMRIGLISQVNAEADVVKSGI